MNQGLLAGFAIMVSILTLGEQAHSETFVCKVDLCALQGSACKSQRIIISTRDRREFSNTLWLLDNNNNIVGIIGRPDSVAVGAILIDDEHYDLIITQPPDKRASSLKGFFYRAQQDLWTIRIDTWASGMPLHVYDQGWNEFRSGSCEE